MRTETEQEIVDGLNRSIESSLATYAAYCREDYVEDWPESADPNFIEKLKKRVQRLRTIREELEDLFAGV